MSRLIDADALLDRIPNLYERREVSRWVDDAPTVDAVPCDMCRYAPPSSGDGKPCTVCPAEGKDGGND